jgi:hypothetical protein
MKDFKSKFPEQIIRLFVVFAIFISLVIIIRRFVIPPSLKETGFHRKSATEREINKEIKYAGAIVCKECHEDIYNKKKDGYHKNLACETCHEAAFKHTENPTEVKPVIPRERKACPLCHEYNPSRPTGFPQINIITHNPLKACASCHNPHDPKPPKTPSECGACHAEIEKTKAVSYHALLKCTTCHETPSKHMIKPRLNKPTKPSEREFCGKCHGKNSNVKETPKIDISTHGEKYLCWQCHYPHMPETL